MNITFDANGKPPTIKQLMQQGYKRDDAKKLLVDAFKAHQSTTAKTEPDPEPKPVAAEPVTEPVGMHDYELSILATLVHDIEKTRKATRNRLQWLTENKQATEPKTNDLVYLDNGEPKMWGLGLPDDHGAVIATQTFFDELGKVESDVVKKLEKRMKAHPLGPFVKRHNGLGNKTVARLLAAVGDPAYNSFTGEPRMLSQLWQYAGHGSESKFTKGQQSFWNSEAKTRLFIIAERCKVTGKQSGSKYRDIYDNRKAETEGKRHTTACAQCKHAEPGDPWKDGHREADALRITGKEILRDLWLEARKYHGLE